MAGADRVEESHEPPGVGSPQATQGVAIQRCDDGIEAAELTEARLRDEAEDLAPVVGASLTAHEVLRLEAIEEARDSWRPLDHSRGDVQGGEAVTP